MFTLIDCNFFYCSCERVFRPDLEGVPVVVLSNNGGCCDRPYPRGQATRHTHGRVLLPVARQAAALGGVQCFSSNYELYGQMSARVMATLGYEYALSDNLSVLISRSLRRSTALEFCEARLR